MAEEVITDRELSWAAGIMEGEGSVRINKCTKMNLGHLVVSVVNTDIEIVQFFQDRWPGYFKDATGLRADQRPAKVWTIAALRAAAFLRQVEPFVRTTRMKRRIAVGLAFQNQKTRSGKVNRTFEYRESQWLFFMEMKELNLRGVRA